MYPYPNQFNQMGQPMSPYNPMMNAQQRLSMLEQQYPQFAQQGQQVTPFLKGRPVSSYDEAKAAMIDLDGSVFYFIDNAHRAIYTKQINLDGTASLNTYVLVDPGKTQQQAQDQQKVVLTDPEPSVTRSEFIQAVTALQDQINSVTDKLKEGVKANVQSVPNDGNAQRKK